MAPKPSTDKPKLGTLSSLQGRGGSDSDEEGSRQQGGQNFFVGGGKSSGQLVEDPNKPINPILEQIQAKAEMHMKSMNENQETEASDSNTIRRSVILWNNGLSIEDGPLLPYTDPKNQQLLKSILAGRAPSEIFNVNYDDVVELAIIKRTGESYQEPPKKPQNPFSGSGQRLGSTNNNNVNVDQSNEAASSAPLDIQPTESYPIDSNLPTTSIQIRLSSGRKIQDIHQFIILNDASQQDGHFQIRISYPNKALLDKSETIESAGLKNASLIHSRI